LDVRHAALKIQNH